MNRADKRLLIHLSLIIVAILLAICVPTLHAEETAIDQLSAALSTHHSALPEGPCLRIAFEEQRSFPFRRYPRKMTGFLWVRNDSNDFVFEYLTPTRMRIHSTDGEISIARGDAETRRTADADADFALFSLLLGDNPSALAQNWDVSEPTNNSNESQTFTLEPLQQARQSGYREVELIFTNNYLTTVIVRRTNGVTHHYHFEAPEPIDCESAANPLQP